VCEAKYVQALVDIRVVDAAHIVATWGRTLIQIWRGIPTAVASAEVNEIANKFVDASSSPANSLFIVESRSPGPDDATRKNFATFSRDIVSRMSIALIVAEGGGFRGAFVRAVGVTLTTMMPHRSLFKFVNDVETAAQLLSPHLLPGSGGPLELVRVVEALRAKMGDAETK
jgi:hypothetical protein